MFGKDEVRRQRPLKTKLARGVWYIESQGPPTGWLGGAFYIQICQSNGKVLNYFGTQ
ncbi:MAG: NTF2 fold immunity protein [Sphingomonadales bacterium]